MGASLLALAKSIYYIYVNCANWKIYALSMKINDTFFNIIKVNN